MAGCDLQQHAPVSDDGDNACAQQQCAHAEWFCLHGMVSRRFFSHDTCVCVRLWSLSSDVFSPITLNGFFCTGRCGVAACSNAVTVFE
mmetsp:Transcript_5397/g.12693  ORF Transcript_5397/g.12693 Transcript_5397/m.12693 type:complete len:88 (+) Transcript_5397:413-676(+)